MEPRRIWQLSFPEQMVVWTVRRWRQGEDSWRHARGDFVNAFGQRDAHIYARAFAGLLTTFVHARLTPTRHGPLYCPYVAPDEEDLLALVRYLHAGMGAAAERLLERHLPPAAGRIALADARAAAWVMEASGYPLEFPPEEHPAPGRSAPAGVTLH